MLLLRLMMTHPFAVHWWWRAAALQSVLERTDLQASAPGATASLLLRQPPVALEGCMHVEDVAWALVLVDAGRLGACRVSG